MNTPNNPQVERYVLLATVLASSMAFIDSSALNVALNAIQKDFNVAGAQLVWIINSYLLMLASLILFSGSLGDQFGRKRVFQSGIILFAGASAVCGIAPTIELLIVARIVQGLGGALMIPGSLAILSASFSDERRSQAIGLWGLFSTVTTIMGPILGGWLAGAHLWRLIFLINVPLAIVSLYALRFVPENHTTTSSLQKLDLPGAFFITLGLGALTYGAIELGRGGEKTGIRPELALLLVVVGFTAFAVFVFIESRSRHPMLDLQLFRSRNFSGANLMTAFLYGALSGALLFFPLNLIQVQGYSEASAGFTMLPVSICLAVLSPLMGRAMGRIGARLLMTVGPFLVGIGFLLLSLPGLTAGVGDYWTAYFPGILCIGLGMGLTVTPLTTTVMSSVSTDSAGTASGVNNAVTRSAQVLMIAIFTIIATNAFANNLTNRLASLPVSAESRTQMLNESSKLGNVPIPENLDGSAKTNVSQAVRFAFAEMFRVMMLVAAALCWISAMISALTIRRVPTATPNTATGNTA